MLLRSLFLILQHVNNLCLTIIKGHTSAGACDEIDCSRRHDVVFRLNDVLLGANLYQIDS